MIFKNNIATENDGPTKVKKKKYFVSFNQEWATKYNCVKKIKDHYLIKRYKEQNDVVGKVRNENTKL